MLQCQINCLWQAAEQLGFKFGSDSLEVLSNESEARDEIALPDGRPFKRVQKLQCLGVMVDFEGSTDTAATHRLAEGAKMWHKVRALLCDRRLPMVGRLAKLDSTVLSCVLHGAGGWSACKGTAVRLQRAEQRALREMLCGRKDYAED